MSADSESHRPSHRPTQYVCPSCRLHLLSWIPQMDTVEMFHKTALWSDFWTGDVRLICQYCLGATDVLPTHLVELLTRRYGFYVPASGSPAPSRQI